MSPRHRLVVFTIFATLFIVLTPFLIFFSLGLDFREGRVVRTLSINSQTFPSGADVYFRGEDIGNTPREFQATAGQQIDLEIRKSGYLDEQFKFWSPEDRSGTARLTNVWLLPEDVDNKDDFDEDTELLGFLPKSQVILREDDEYSVTTFNAAGLSSSRQEINNTEDITIESGNWDVITERGFWNKKLQLFLLPDGDEWDLYDLNSIFPVVEDMVRIDENRYLIRDNQNNLWEYVPDQQPAFVASNVRGLYRMQLPNSIWIWKDDSIFRINEFEDVFDFELRDAVISDVDLLSEEGYPEISMLKSIPLNQGIVLRAGRMVWYIPDLDGEYIKLLKNVAEIGSDGELLFWIDNQRSLHSLNLQLQRQRTYGSLDIDLEKDVELFYYFEWRRIMVYAEDKVYSAWIEKDFANDYIMQYDAQEWLNLNCMNEVINRIQYCMNEETFFVYKNARRFL